MENGGGVGSNSYSMGFGENVSGMSPMMMMVPFMTSPFSSNNNNHNPSSSNSNNMNNKNNNNQRRCYLVQQNTNDSDSGSMRLKIMSHPHYSRLLAAYINCQKIGAPGEVVARLEDVYASTVSMLGTFPKSCIGQDPALDQFMEAYIEMLTKYEQELSKPFKEAMAFFSRAEGQLNALLTVSSSVTGCHTTLDQNELSEEDADASDIHIDPRTGDKDLKIKLLRKYSGYLGGLKQEFMKKKKTVKLPKEARQQLMDWWSKHHKWPYPSESQKVALAEATGLDQKQINNWFINQRKRHWKPSDEMQLAVLEGMHPQYYMNSMLTTPFHMDCSPLL